MKFNKVLPILLLATLVASGCTIKKPSTSSNSEQPESSEQSQGGESTETTESVDTSVYTLAITNKANLTAPWVVEDGSRALVLDLKKDGEVVNAAMANINGEITVVSEHPEFVTANGLALTPVAVGTSKITVTYHGQTDEVSVTISDAVKKVTLAELRAGIADGSIVKDDVVEFKGIIAGAYDLVGGNTGHAYAGVYVADGDAAMLLYAGSGDGNIGTAWEKQSLKIGDAIQVRGVLAPYGDLQEVKPSITTKLATTEGLTAPTTFEVTGDNFTEAGFTGNDSRKAHATFIYKDGTIAKDAANTVKDKTHTTVHALMQKQDGSYAEVDIAISYHLAGALDALKEFFDGLEAGDKFEALGFASFSGTAPQFALGYVGDKTPVQCLTNLHQKAAATKVVVSGPAEVQATDTITLSAAVLPATAAQTVVWSSSDDTKATVDPATGVVTGVAEGTVTIRATASGTEVYGEKEISVTPAPTVDATGIQLSVEDNKTGAKIGETVQLVAAVAPAGAPSKVFYVSSNDKVATVDDTGLVTFLADGEVTITAYASKAGERVDSIHDEVELATVVENLKTYQELATLGASLQNNKNYKENDVEVVFSYRGVVVSKKAAKELIVADATGALESYNVNPVTGYTPEVGDTVLVQAKLTKYYDLFEMVSGTIYKSYRTIENAVGTGEATVVSTLAEWEALATAGLASNGKKIALSNALIAKNANGYANISAISGDVEVKSTTYGTVDHSLPSIPAYATKAGYADVVAHILSCNTSTKTLTIWVDEFTMNDAADADNIVVTADKESININGKAVLTVVVNATAADAALYKNPAQAVTFSSSAKGVATVNENGVVTGVAQGTAVITVAQVADPTITKTITITVSDQVEETWARVSSIKVGDVVVFVNEANHKEMTSIGTYGVVSDYDGAIAHSFKLEVVAGSKADTFAFKNGTKYVSWSLGNSLALADEVNDNSSWTVTISDGIATITNAADSTRIIKYNSGSPRFAAYNNSNSPALSLYAKVEA